MRPLLPSRRLTLQRRGLAGRQTASLLALVMSMVVLQGRAAQTGVVAIADGPPFSIIRGDKLLDATKGVLERVTQLLSRYLGPIAPILTKKAAQTAVDESQLYSLLAGKLSDPVEKARFMREAQRISSDLLRPPGS